MERYRNIYPLHLLLALLVGLFTACINDDEEDAGESALLVNVGDRVPDFVLLGDDGVEVSAASLAGQTYILNFFDTACPDCQEEFAVLQRLYDQYQGRVPILNVPRSQTRDDVQAYWRQAALTMPFYIPADKDLYYKFAKRTIPRTFVVDGSGLVLAAYDDAPIADYESLSTLLQQHQTNAARQDSVSLTLRVRVPALVGANDEYYFHNEHIISSLYIYFFDAETKQFRSKASVEGLTKEELFHETQYDITYLFNTIRLHVGVYDVFAVANYSSIPDDVTDETAFLNLVDSVTYHDGIEASMPDTGPVMTSPATAFLAIDFLPWANKNYYLNMELDRVMAKLQIGVQKNSFQLTDNGRKYADVNITNYKLVNMNRSYYLFQHKDHLSELGPQPTFMLPDNFSDYTDEGEQYVVDPLFYKKSCQPASVAMCRQYYRSWYGDFTTEGFASMPSAENHGYAYVLENTTFKTCQKNGYSPGIVFKAAVNPVFVYLYDNALRTLKEETRPEYWPKTIYLYNCHFYESIQAINVASGLSLDELETYTDAQLKTYGIKQLKFNMGVYETYYTYWIQHRNSLNDFMGPMQYGIVRNNFYKIVIAGVSGLGDSSITPEVLRDNYPNSYTDILVTASDNP